VSFSTSSTVRSMRNLVDEEFERRPPSLSLVVTTGR
jgi:hypothetical protein